MFRKYLTALLVLLAVSSIDLLASPHPSDWLMVGPWGGTATVVTVDPQSPRILLSGGQQSLLYLSKDGGNSWVLLPFPKQTLGEVESVAIDPLNASHFLVGIAGPLQAGLFESYDTGQTWKANPMLAGLSIRALTISPMQKEEVLAGSSQGVFLSKDSGRHWVPISERNNVEMLGITAVAFGATPETIYAGTTHLPWKTSDGGHTWTSINKGMIDDSDIFSLSVDYSAPDKILASACSGVYVSDNGGTSWHKITGISQSYRRTHIIRRDVQQSMTVYAGTTLGLLKSINGGASWQQLNSVQVNSLALIPSQPSHLFLALENDGPSRSTNHGESLQTINNGFVARHLTAITAIGKRLLAVELDREDTTAIFLSDNAGVTWKKADPITGLDGIRLRTITGISNGLLFAADAHKLFWSADSGHTWLPLANDLAYSPNRYNVSNEPETIKPAHQASGSHDACPPRINRLYSIENEGAALLLAATNAGLYLSRDLGRQWQLAPTGKGADIVDIYASSSVDGQIAVRSAKDIYWTDNYGRTWSRLSPPVLVSEVRDIAIPPITSQAPIILATTRGLFYSNRQSGAWSLVSEGLPASSAEAVIYSSKGAPTAYAVMAGQLYISRDECRTWTVGSYKFSPTQIRRLWCCPGLPNRIFAITSDIGILIRDEES